MLSEAYRLSKEVNWQGDNVFEDMLHRDPGLKEDYTVLLKLGMLENLPEVKHIVQHSVIPATPKQKRKYRKCCHSNRAKTKTSPVQSLIFTD